MITPTLIKVIGTFMCLSPENIEPSIAARAPQEDCIYIPGDGRAGFMPVYIVGALRRTEDDRFVIMSAKTRTGVPVYFAADPRAVEKLLNTSSVLG